MTIPPRSWTGSPGHHRINSTYWSLNPDSADTGGVLEDDWKTVRIDKMELLITHLAPRLAVPVPA